MAIRLPLSNEVIKLWPSQKRLHGTLELFWKPASTQEKTPFEKKIILLELI